MPRRYEFKTGQIVGPWRLVEPLGRGSNGEVWRATRPGMSDAALKISLHRNPDAARYKRFVDEVRFYARLGDRPGILPLLDSYLPERPNRHDRPWLAMRIATPLSDRLGADPEPDEVVRAVAQIANALAALTMEGVAHRDVKPGNLYFYDDEYVVGDFGLVDFPGKEALTEEGEKLGPAFYLAPEMLSRSQDADGGPADVYSLAKTLWVLATGQRYPPPGEHRIDEPSLLLSTYVSHPRAHLLDLLIERATRHSTNDRPSMREFCDELRAWQSPAKELASAPDLSDLRRRLDRVMAPKAAAATRWSRLNESAQTGFQQLVRALESAHAEVRQASIGEVGQINAVPNSGCWEMSRFAIQSEPDGATGIGFERACFHVRLPAEAGVSHYLVAGVGHRVFSDGSVRLWACYDIWPKDAHVSGDGWQGQGTEVWADTKLCPAGSAEAEHAASELSTAFVAHLRGALARLIEMAEVQT